MRQVSFMIWALKNYKITDSCTLDGIIFNLDPGDKAEKFFGYQMSRFSKFDAAQEATVVSFLKFMATNGDEFTANSAQEALDHYWQKKETA